MANLVFKVGTLDLSNFIRVNPDDRMEPAQGDMAEPAFSDSPFFEGQTLNSLHIKNKELKIPLFLHPPTAPYTQDALNQLVQQVNQALRPVVDLGLTTLVTMQLAQASNPTFFTLKFGRFEPDFNFRITERGWFAGVLHLWVLPYAHTATERSLGTYAAAANGLQVLPASMLAAGGTVVGDVPPQLDLRITTGSYVGGEGRLGIVAALPQSNYVPMIPPASFINLTPSAVILGASGAWGSQMLALDSTVASAGQAGASHGVYAGQGFGFALSPGSVYVGDQRILGLVRARSQPFGLRAFDGSGNPLGPTAVASSLDGWQVVDYGVLRSPAWQPTVVVNIISYDGIPYTASGQFAPARTPWNNGWTKEHGPIMVLPADSTVLDLDWNTTVVAVDGFDGPAGTPIGMDSYGNTWQPAAASAVLPVYDGAGGVKQVASGAGWFAMIGSSIPGDFSVELNMLILPSAAIDFNVYLGTFYPAVAGVNPDVAVTFGGNGIGGYVLNSGLTANQSLTALVPGLYHLTVYYRNGYAGYALGAPSGAFPNADKGLTLGASSLYVPALGRSLGATTTIAGFLSTRPSGVVPQAFRAKAMPSSGMQPRDILRLYQPDSFNVRQTPSGVNTADLQARQRGPVQGPALPVPSLGSGLFCAALPWDFGPVNDTVNVDVRVRERFTYAR